MASVISGGFDGNPTPSVNDWIRRLTAIISIASSEEFLQRLETLLEIPPQSFAPSDVAAMEHVKPEAVRDWIRKGKLRAVPDPNRRAGPHPRLVILAEDYWKFKRGGQ